MKFFTLVLCVVAVAALTPQCSGRVRRAALPQRTMMFYYNRPHPGYGRPFVSRNYEPHTAMSAFAAGNTVSAGSFYGAQQQPQAVPAPDCSQCNGVLPPAPEVPSDVATTAAPAPAPEDRHEEAVPEETPVVDEQPEEQLPNDEPVAVSTEAPVVVRDEPKSKDTPRGKVPASKPGKRRPLPPVQEDEEEDDDSDDEESPLPGLLPGGKKKKGQGNFYNSYFPIFFGGYPSGRSGAEGGNPGAATAIANSFSTGKGAVATSHATAYGGPAPNGNGYKKNGAKARYSSAARS